MALDKRKKSDSQVTFADIILSVLPWPFHKDLPSPNAEDDEKDLPKDRSGNKRKITGTAMQNSDLENVLKAVNDQVILLSYRWKIFCQLFDSGQDNIDVLNKSGSNVFELFQRLALDDVMISLSKLTDPEGVGDKENASVRNLLAKASAHLKLESNAEIEALMAKLDGHVENLRKHRHKVLAHADLRHALTACALPAVTYDDLENAMATLQSIISKIASEVYGWTTHYSPTIPYGCGGDTLLAVLTRGHGLPQLKR